MHLLTRYAAAIVLATFLVVFPQQSLKSWGFYGHKRINEIAVYTLPPELFGFYKFHLDYIVDHSVDPDKRRYGIKGEAPRHYIDIDHYCHSDECDPFENVPKYWKNAVEKFSEDTLMAYGIVPWHIDKMVWKLTKAFEEENVSRILQLSAELGHYVGDAHVPLHTTENYNGQLTNQKGIHGFWESRLPELYDDRYDYFVGKASYVEKPLDRAWDAVKGSHAALDSVLRFEKELTLSFPSDQKYSYEQRGVTMMKTYSEEFSNAYHTRLNGQVERRMKSAIITIGSLWYTAWINAGQPDLDKYVDDLKDLPIVELRPDSLVLPHSLRDEPDSIPQR